MSYEEIQYEVNQGVATITLNRPHTLNAFNNQMIKDCTHAFKTAGRDAAVRAILFTGAGRGFSSGQDLIEASGRMGDPDGSLGTHLRATYHILINHMISLEKPIIGAINGIAAGIGLSIALATDIRIASDKAAFTLGFSKIGLVPDGGANWVLPRLIGYARAYEMAVTADKIPADQAHAWGMVNHIIPHDQLAEYSTAYAQRLAQGATLAYGLTKRAMWYALDQTLSQNLDYEAYLQDIAGRSDDCREGVMSFIEKRPPAFKGQ